MLTRSNQLLCLALLCSTFTNFLDSKCPLRKVKETKSGNVISIKSQSDYDNFSKKKGKKVIKFGAVWCPACKQFDPEYKELAKNYSHVAKFADVDVDDSGVRELVTKNSIKGIPATQILDDNGKVIHTIVGGDKQGLENQLKSFKDKKKNDTKETTTEKVKKHPKTEEKITEVKSKDEFDQIVKEESRPIIVEFYSKACHFCKEYDPEYKKIASQFADKAKFVRLDFYVRSLQRVAKSYNVQGLPTTIIIFKDKTHKTIISNKEALKSELERL